MTTPAIQIGDWSSDGLDDNGVTWRMDTLTGWDEPPPARGDYTSRPSSNGAFDMPIYDDPRVITIGGTAEAPDTMSLAAAKRQLAVVARSLRDGATITGHMVDGDYTVTAKRTAGWAVDPIGTLNLAYTAIVTCTDPYKYGPQVSGTTGLPAAGSGGLVFPLFDVTSKLEFGSAGVTGQLTLANNGTTDATITFTITGPVLGGLSLTDVGSGSTIVFADDVPGASTLLIIDSAAGRATLNGADRTGELTTKQWWSVPAGGSSTVQFTTLGAGGQSGTLTASLLPAFE